MRITVSPIVLEVPFVDLTAQYASIKEEIDGAIARVIADCAFVGGPYIERFEREFANFCGANYCVGLANGTDALFLALKALGIGHGDEVLTAANSFIATAEAITLTGARVVFVDVDPHTYNIDVAQIEKKISERTRAVLPVHLYGQPANMDAIRRIARKHGLFVVGDAAQAHGATFQGKRIAEWADLTCFSFYPGKNLGAYGDGGAVVTDNAEWAETIRVFANHGRVGKYDHKVEGVNSRLDGLQAAILSVKLRHLEDWTERRRASARRYTQLLEGADLHVPVETDDRRAVYHLFVVRVANKRRAGLQEFLKERGVQTGIHYPIALPYLQAYRHLQHGDRDFPHALEASQQILSLPMCAELTEDQIRHVADSIREFMKGE